MSGRLGLRGRLALSIAALVIIAFGVAFFAAYRITGSQLRAGIDRDLRSDVHSFAQRLAAAPRSAPSQFAAASRYIGAQPFGPTARLLVITVPGVGTVSNQPELLNHQQEQGEPAATTRVEREQAGGLRSAPPGYSDVKLEDAGNVRLLTSRLTAAGTRPVVIRAGEPLESVERAQSEVAGTFLIVGALTLAAALIAGYLLAARTAAPLRRMARIAAAVDAGDLEHRIGASGPRDEIRALAESFDHMLDRLEDAFSRQKEFVSDASHELRTPLTALRGQIEVLALEPDPEPERVAEVEAAALREIGRMQRLVEDLLVLARLDEGVTEQREQVELEPLLTELVEAARANGGSRIELGSLPAGSLRADPDQVVQLIRNLLGNAIEHAGPAGQVRISAAAREGEIEIAVEDDGPGIPAEHRERVFDRFHRVDAGRTRSSGGSGLGLAIARAIAEAHGGSISVGDSPLGGARIAVRMPGFEAGAGSRSV